MLQLQAARMVLLELALKRLTPAERRWDTREREAFAVKWATKCLSDYIRGQHTFVISDYQSLWRMSVFTDGKVQRWALFLQ